MLIKSTKTLILLGVVALGATACDTEAPEAAASAQDAAADQGDAPVYRNPGEFAICLSNCADNHCAYAMGGCLRATAECGGEEGCETAYEACAEQLVAPACQVEGQVELKSALSCWNTFSGCLQDSDDSVGCLGDLYACAQEGCGEDGCEDAVWAEDALWPMPEEFFADTRP